MRNTLVVFFFAITCIYVNAQVIVPVDSVKVDSVQKDQPGMSSFVGKKPHKLYHFNPCVDIPIVAIAGGWSGFAFSKIYNKTPSSREQIIKLDKKNVPSIDRWAAGMHDENADANSNYLFYGSIPVPFFLFLDKNIRKDAAKISYLYLEAMSITGLFYTGSVFLVDRYRPEAYDTRRTVDDRLSGNEKDAFLAGHPALVATSLFFTAKVYADYNPDSRLRYVLYGVAIAGTGATAYLRHIAGKHFPTDLLTGITLGTACGILVPQLHKYKDKKDNGLSFLPYFDGQAKGLSIVYSPD